MSEISYSFKNACIETNPNGIAELLGFYNYASKYKYAKINLNFTELNHFDANLSALLLALIHKLRVENKLYIYIDIPNHMNVLFRNGLLSHLKGNGNLNEYEDNRKSTIPLKCFLPNQEDEFCEYLKSEFFAHRGLDNLSYTIKANLRTHYLEMFINAVEHSNSNLPIFTCGQYFPEKNILKFTLVDIGEGFLKKINAKTNGQIVKDSDALVWACLDNNTTKKDNIGGIGLKDLKKYCNNNNGSFHLCSGIGFVNFIGVKTIENRMQNIMPGSIVNITLRKI